MAGCQYKIHLDLRVVSVTLCYTGAIEEHFKLGKC